jgi:hypothetical protein
MLSGGKISAREEEDHGQSDRDEHWAAWTTLSQGTKEVLWWWWWAWTWYGWLDCVAGGARARVGQGRRQAGGRDKSRAKKRSCGDTKGLQAPAH